MLERNILSHLKLALLLSLLSSSLLLGARLVPNTKEDNESASSIPLASLQFIAAIASVSAGVWEYYKGFQDMRMARAFLAAPKCVVLCRVTFLCFFKFFYLLVSI